jgi:RNA polymerase sigma-70 factor, ECF subfamily
VLVPADRDFDEEPRAPRPKSVSFDTISVSFDTIYAEHFAFVWRNLRRLGVGESGLRDAAQDVFLVVHRRLPDFEGKSSVRTWLFTILRRVASDHRRRRGRKELRDAEDAELVPDARGAGPEDQAVRGESRRLLLALLERLDPEKREVLILADLESMSAPEIASALECNVNTVYSRLRAARQLMREGFERHHAERRRRP